MDKIDILGIKVDNVTLDEAVKRCEGFLRDGGKHVVVTPNPEFIVAAWSDLKFRRILNEADLAIPDGVGLVFASRIFKLKADFARFFHWDFARKNQHFLKGRVAGVDLVEALCKFSEERALRVGFLGGARGVAKRAAGCLKIKFPKLQVAFASVGGEVDLSGKIEWEKITENDSVDILNQAFDILFVAFGQVKQEKWIADNLASINCKLAIGVGGAFDYLSGGVVRAPFFIRKIGLEWLFRLFVQPWRIRRQLRLLQFIWAVVVK